MPHLITRAAVLLVLVSAISFHPVPSQAADRPNIIFFIADDVSWNDYGCYGNTSARTPSIDQLAEDGIRFDRAYLTASSCSPSRSSIITGRYPHNNGKAAELHLPISAHLPWFPEVLHESGYFTALSGKHHMKSAKPDRSPAKRPVAFDHVDGGKSKGDTSGSANWVSVIDLAPTALSVAGCEIPDTVQGLSMTPLFQNLSATTRKFAFSEHNWHDYEAFGRSVRHGDYMLLLNERANCLGRVQPIRCGVPHTQAC